MSREYARRSKGGGGGGGSLPLIIAIVGTVIVIAVIAYFLLSGGSSGTSLFGNSEATATEAVATYTPVSETATPGATATPTEEPTVQVILSTETVEEAITTATATPTPAPSYATCTVWANALNVREGPGVDYGVIGTVDYGSTYKVYDETTKWLKIQLSSGSYGWIWADYCVRGDATVPSAPTSEPEDSIVSSASIDSTSSTITITFSESAYGSSTYTDYVNIDEDYFTVTEDGTDILTSVSDCGGGTTIYLYIDGTAGAEIELEVDGSGIYTEDGEDTGDYSKTFNAGADVTAPTTSWSVSSAVVTLTFSEAVYSTASESGALDTSDFSVTDSNSFVDSFTVSHTAGSKTCTITISYTGMVTGNTTDTVVTLYSSSAYDAAGNSASSSTKSFTYTSD